MLWVVVQALFAPAVLTITFCAGAFVWLDTAVSSVLSVHIAVSSITVYVVFVIDTFVVTLYYATGTNVWPPQNSRGHSCWVCIWKASHSWSLDTVEAFLLPKGHICTLRASIQPRVSDITNCTYLLFIKYRLMFSQNLCTHKHNLFCWKPSNLPFELYWQQFCGTYIW